MFTDDITKELREEWVLNYRFLRKARANGEFSVSEFIKAHSKLIDDIISARHEERLLYDEKYRQFIREMSKS